MGYDAPGLHIVEAALDARDDFQFAPDLSGNCFSGEEGLGAAGPLGKFAKSILEFR